MDIYFSSRVITLYYQHNGIFNPEDNSDIIPILQTRKMRQEEIKNPA